MEGPPGKGVQVLRVSGHSQRWRRHLHGRVQAGHLCGVQHQPRKECNHIVLLISASVSILQANGVFCTDICVPKGPTAAPRVCGAQVCARGTAITTLSRAGKRVHGGFVRQGAGGSRGTLPTGRVAMRALRSHHVEVRSEYSTQV